MYGHKPEVSAASCGEGLILVCSCGWRAELDDPQTPDLISAAWNGHKRRVRWEKNRQHAQLRDLRAAVLAKRRLDGLRKLTPEEREALGL